MAEYRIAFWNVENLFDIENSPERPDKIARLPEIRAQLRGWSEEVLARKIAQLARIIGEIGGAGGPDVLGVCEVENARVVNLLAEASSLATGRHYAVLHADTGDRRGIDVAFLYDPAVFAPLPDSTFQHAIQMHKATRELFQVSLAPVGDTAELVLVGNHWPSRSGGEAESEAYRIVAAETLAYWHQRIREIKGRDVCLIALGDFNDEPFSPTLAEHAGAERLAAKVLNARDNVLFQNLMWPFLGLLQGSYYFDGDPNCLDQFLVSRGLLRGGAFRVVAGSVRIEALPAMTRTRGYPAPIAFSAPSAGSDYNPDGFSDHFPISLRLERLR